MPTMAQLQVCSFEESMVRLKKLVFKNRIRLREFLQDFDRLRSGTMFENHFISGLSISGVDKGLSPQQIGTIVDQYRTQVTPSMSMIDWRAFVEDVDVIFTTKGLDRDPLLEIAKEPTELLDKTRYAANAVPLTPGLDDTLAATLDRLQAQVRRQGVLVKPMFDDFAKDANSIRLKNHVTPRQFAQTLNVKLGFAVSADELELLLEKYVDINYGDMVNYVAFSAAVDPPEAKFDPYSLV